MRRGRWRRSEGLRSTLDAPGLPAHPGPSVQQHPWQPERQVGEGDDHARADQLQGAEGNDAPVDLLDPDVGQGNWRSLMASLAWVSRDS